MASRKSQSAPAKWSASIIEVKPLEWLKPFAKNPRIHSTTQVKQLAAAIRRWGWTIPVLALADGTIVAGHGRVLAARALKMKACPVIIAEGWSEEDVHAYVIADNKLTEAADWNKELLALELSWLAERGQDAKALGFSGAELDSVMAALNKPGAFLDDLADGGAHTTEERRRLTEGVALTLMMLPAERDAVIAFLNHERTTRKLRTVAAALIAMATEWHHTPEPVPPAKRGNGRARARV